MSEKLLPCAHCGSLDIDYQNYGSAGHLVVCKGCGCSTTFFGSGEQAVAAWNTRANDSLPTYYLLRRTVGGATMHYEYDDIYNGWVLNQHYASLHVAKEFAETRASKVGPCEIIPIKLVEVVT